MSSFAAGLPAGRLPANFSLHVQGSAVVNSPPTGDDLVKTLSTLANPHRLRVVAALVRRRSYVSELARELGISRPLLQVHLRRLEAAGLVTATIQVSADGKAMKFYEVSDFAFTLTPAAIEVAERTLTDPAGTTPAADHEETS
jgi:DNA-binding transcriptional ArsR family regulator